jgi:hypothetical protein
MAGEGQSAGMRSPGLSLLPLVLAVLGAAIPLAGSGFTVWGMAAVWLGGVAAVAVARAVARPRPSTLVFIDLVLLALALVVLAPEGGWWFVPAVAAQTLLDRRAAARVADNPTRGRAEA